MLVEFVFFFLFLCLHALAFLLAEQRHGVEKAQVFLVGAGGCNHLLRPFFGGAADIDKEIAALDRSGIGGRRLIGMRFAARGEQKFDLGGCAEFRSELFCKVIGSIDGCDNFQPAVILCGRAAAGQGAERKQRCAAEGCDFSDMLFHLFSFFSVQSAHTP